MNIGNKILLGINLPVAIIINTYIDPYRGKMALIWQVSEKNNINNLATITWDSLQMVKDSKWEDPMWDHLKNNKIRRKRG